jgi:hypothetical protein
MYKFIAAVQIYYRIVNNFAKTIIYEALQHFLVICDTEYIHVSLPCEIISVAIFFVVLWLYDWPNGGVIELCCYGLKTIQLHLPFVTPKSMVRLV